MGLYQWWWWWDVGNGIGVSNGVFGKRVMVVVLCGCGKSGGVL